MALIPIFVHEVYITQEKLIKGYALNMLRFGTTFSVFLDRYFLESKAECKVQYCDGLLYGSTLTDMIWYFELRLCVFLAEWNKIHIRWETIELLNHKFPEDLIIHFVLLVGSLRPLLLSVFKSVENIFYTNVPQTMKYLDYPSYSE